MARKNVVARKYAKVVKVNRPGGKASASKTQSRGGRSGKGTSPRKSPASAPYYPSFRERLARRLDGLRRSPSKMPTKQTAPSKGTAAVKGSSPAKPSLSSGLSLDRKLDLVGIGMAIIGLLTLLSLFSATQSATAQGWLSLLAKAFGWGAYLFPIGLITVGVWLILRNFERVPSIQLERLMGLTLLYLLALTILQFLAFPESSTDSYDLAAVGKGGGYVGAFFLDILRSWLGVGGAMIALLAWLLIGLIMVLDITVAELFNWVPPLVLRLQDWWDDRRLRRTAPAARPFSLPGYEPVKAASQPANAPPVSTSAGEPQVAPKWVLPRIEDILEEGREMAMDDESDRQRARLIEETLASFGAPVNVVEINRGPTITQFGVEPDFVETRSGRTRVRVGKIAALADDLALALAAKTIRVQAPVPGKGYVGIEVPNEEVSLVALRDVMESEAFHRLKSPLRFGLGQDVAGNTVAADLSAMPHLLIAGATGTGKSVCVNSLICNLLMGNTPDDLRLIMVDPKRVELTGYNGIPHLLAPVVVETERVVGALQWVLREMDNRYHKLAQEGSRNIGEYNGKLEANGAQKLPRLVVIIDELADLMMLAPDETERTITRLAQLARATGIHLVISTQRPSVDVVTGLIKANFPARIAFAVASGVDSRVILDQPGAERLLGRGDMLFQAPDAPTPLRLQGSWVSEAEIQRLVQYWLSFVGLSTPVPMSTGGVVDALPAGVPLKQIPMWDEMTPQEEADPLLQEAIDLSRRQGRSSISMLQRRLRIGYTRAARLVETMQEKGIIGSEAGPQGFEVLDYGDAAPPVDER
jgi:S-DNA-T family DNA segregation ATPase FtsK/SpoIIIE